MNKNNTNNKDGFTLIEIAIVMIIAGFFMVMLIKVYEQYTIENKKAEITQKINQITSALAFYIKDDGLVEDEAGRNFLDPLSTISDQAATAWDETQDPARYPCPAGPLLGPDDPEFGLELRNNNGTCAVRDGVVATGPAANRVFIGSVPTITLDISSDQMLDEYKNRFTYAVSDSVSNARAGGPVNGALGDGDNPPGSIIIDRYRYDAAAAAIQVTTHTRIPFAIISHGQNGAGARTLNGNIKFPCANGGRDSENCNNNRRFSDAMLYGSSNINDASQYDDKIVYSLRGIQDKEDYWGLSDANGLDIQSLSTGNLIIPNGNVGIGTNTPSQKVDIDGRVRAHSYLHASDKRLKENIKGLETALDNIEDINIVTYDYKDKNSPKKQMGVIAQEIQDIYPELVHEGTDGYLSVDYVSLTAPIIKALQELSEKQDNEIRALKKQINELSKSREDIDIKEEKKDYYHNSKEIYYND